MAERAPTEEVTTGSMGSAVIFLLSSSLFFFSSSSSVVCYPPLLISFSVVFNRRCSNADRCERRRSSMPKLFTLSWVAGVFILAGQGAFQLNLGIRPRGPVRSNHKDAIPSAVHMAVSVFTST
jgi:hypothetical protein